MDSYGVRDVERLLGVSRATLRALVDAQVPRRRITRSVRELRRHLPESMPLSGLSIGAVGDRVVVREGRSRWQADSGQYLLAFEGDPARGALSVIERKPDWCERARALEESDPQAAVQAFREAVASEPENVDAHVNLGWLLHDAGRLGEAEQAYRAGLKACGEEPLLWYNLGVLLADQDRKDEAAEAYQAALRARSDFADCHYNLALLCEELGRPRDAIRHMARYRRLTSARPD